MTGLHRLAWRSLRARPLRTFLTSAGVALGVAVLSAGLATNAGVDAAIDRAVWTILGQADLRVTSVGETGLSEPTVTIIDETPGVAFVAPAYEQRTYLGLDLFAPGDALPAPVTVAGIDPEAEAALHDLTLADGTGLDAATLDTALVSATLAREDGLRVGSSVSVQGPEAPTTFRVIGILAADGPWADTSGRAVVVPLAAAQAAFGATGVTRVDIALADDVVAAAAIEHLQTTIDAAPYLVATPLDVARDLRASTGEFAATTALIAAVALFAGAFLIVNTLSMTVVERLRELGLLRAAGATRGQLTSFILVQAFVIGLAGSVVGVGLGVLLATGMAGWVGSIGAVAAVAPSVTLPDILAAVGIGLAVTLAAAAEPARRAGRVTPVEALKARLELPATRRARSRWLVAVFLVVGVVGLLVWPRAAGEAALVRSMTVYAAMLLVVLAIPLVLPALTRLAGSPYALVARLEERLARASILRDRSRSTLTVGALTVGLALIVALGGLGQHARAAASAWIADVVPGDLVVTSIFPRSADEGIVEALEAAAGVATLSPIASFDLAVAGVRADGAAMVGADLAAEDLLQLVAGDRSTAFAALDAGGAVIIPAGIAVRDGLAVGDRVSVAAADGSALDLTVVAVAERTLPGASGESWLVGWPDAERLGVAGADAFAVRFEPTATPGDQAAFADAARGLALEPTSLGRIQGAIGAALDRVFGLFDALAVIAVIVAALGIVNTLTMNVLERVREIGVLRAAGMTRRQVWRSVVVEAGVTGLIGAVCGIATGIGIGALMVVLTGGRLADAANLPWPAIAVALVLGVVLAMLAAAYPARLASSLSIVRAVGHE
jgi:putative ABC transport system permease protein